MTAPADIVAVLRDLMLDRAERGLPVAWIAEVGQPKGRPVQHPLHAWVAERTASSLRLGRLWVIRRTSALGHRPRSTKTPSAPRTHHDPPRRHRLAGLDGPRGRRGCAASAAGGAAGAWRRAGLQRWLPYGEARSNRA